MTDPSDLDSHLDRLMESAYDALAQRAEERQRRADVHPPEPDLPAAIGPYPVSGLLGRGGTSCVYRGRDLELGRDLAIKVIDQRYEPDSALGKRFLDEARICSQLSHPGIVPIHAIGQLEDGRPYFTMRLVEGQTFGALLDARANPDDRLQQFLEIFARVVETIAFAHARGVVHGDLKPGNVMVGAFGQVQVMDWGFSRVVDGAEGGTPGRGMGTPAFMAPEQAGNGALDARADVFGLGAILCVVLTGAPPFLGGSRSEIHVRAAQGCLGDALLRLRVCGADAELVQLAVHCLARAPEERPTAEQVAARLSAWFVSIEERARRLELAAAQAKVVAVEQRRTRRRSIALAVLAAVFAVVYAWMRFERQARDYDARVAVVQAIERARNLRAGADIAGSERIRLLGEAAVAAQHATTFASTLDDAALCCEAARLAKRLAEDRDAAVRDERMLRWLDDFPAHLDRTSEQLVADFAQGFRDWGVDVEGSPVDDVSARLRAGSDAASLARALDDWGAVRRAQPRVPPAAWRRFHELALRVDADPQRSTVRRALLAGDRDELRRLADAPGVPRRADRHAGPARERPGAVAPPRRGDRRVAASERTPPGERARDPQPRRAVLRRRALPAVGRGRAAVQRRHRGAAGQCAPVDRPRLRARGTGRLRGRRGRAAARARARAARRTRARQPRRPAAQRGPARGCTRARRSGCGTRTGCGRDLARARRRTLPARARGGCGRRLSPRGRCRRCRSRTRSAWRSACSSSGTPARPPTAGAASPSGCPAEPARRRASASRCGSRANSTLRSRRSCAAATIRRGQSTATSGSTRRSALPPRSRSRTAPATPRAPSHRSCKRVR
jgi:hypothetical protein